MWLRIGHSAEAYDPLGFQRFATTQQTHKSDSMLLVYDTANAMFSHRIIQAERACPGLNSSVPIRIPCSGRADTLSDTLHSSFSL